MDGENNTEVHDFLADLGVSGGNPKEDTPTDDGDDDILDVADLEEDDSSGGEDPPVDDPSDDGPPDEMQALKEQVAVLQAQLNGKDKKEEETTPKAPEYVQADLKEINFFEGHNVEDLMQDPDAFVNWFSSAIQKVREADRDANQQAMLQNIPGVIRHHVTEQVEGQQAAKQFYTANEDLIGHKPVVARMANTVNEAFPELAKEPDKFYAKVAELSRAALGLTERVKKEDTPKKRKETKPALVNDSVKSKTKRTPAEELSPMEKQIQDLIN